MSKNRLPALDPEDQALWDALKREVTPLHEGRLKSTLIEVSPSPPPGSKPGRPANKTRQPRQKSQDPKAQNPNPQDTGLVWQAPGQFANLISKSNKPAPGLRHPNDLRAGGSRGLDRAKAERLRKGKMSIEGTIDLHGLTQDQAHVRLEQFVTSASKAGKRTLLVITGKGVSNGGQGVLRARVPEWLGQGALGRCVLAFSYAQKRDGEQGALYVLLRRQHG